MLKNPLGPNVIYNNPRSRSYDVDPDSMSVIDEIIKNSGVVLDETYARKIDMTQHKIHDAYLASNTAVSQRTYTFFVRPDLNLMHGEGVVNPNANLYTELYHLTKMYPELALQLCVSATPHDRLIPLLSNHIREMSPIDVGEDGRDGVRNMYGKSMFLPGVFDFMSKTVDISFSDNKYGDVSKLFYIWGRYKDAVTRDGFSMAEHYKATNKIDYVTSIYQFTVDEMNNIIAWGKCTAAMPTGLPTHMIQHKSGQIGLNELIQDFSVTFNVFEFKPLDPITLVEFNVVSGFNPAKIIPIRKVTSDSQVLSNNQPYASKYSDHYKNLFRSKVDVASNYNNKGIPHVTGNQFLLSGTGNQTFALFGDIPGVIYNENTKQYQLVFSSR